MTNNLCAAKTDGESKAGVHVLHIPGLAGLSSVDRIRGGIWGARRGDGLGVADCPQVVCFWCLWGDRSRDRSSQMCWTPPCCLLSLTSHHCLPSFSEALSPLHPSVSSIAVCLATTSNALPDEALQKLLVCHSWLSYLLKIKLSGEFVAALFPLIFYN